MKVPRHSIGWIPIHSQIKFGWKIPPSVDEKFDLEWITLRSIPILANKFSWKGVFERNKNDLTKANLGWFQLLNWLNRNHILPLFPFHCEIWVNVYFSSDKMFEKPNLQIVTSIVTIVAVVAIDPCKCIEIATIACCSNVFNPPWNG